MYSLVALGFVLVYKTSGVLNFAQGAMVLFAALTFVSLTERNVPFAIALALTLVAMIVLGFLIERLVLAPLVNQSPITLFMATLGLSYVIEGAAQLIWGTEVHGLELGIPDTPLHLGVFSVSTFDLVAALIAGTMVLALLVFFRATRTGLAFRAVADDQFAALAVGLRLSTIWTIVWTLAGVVALVAGLLWGARLGVQFSLSTVVLKALPVLVLAEVYLGPLVGGGIESWIAYVVTLLFLLVRPAGLFGQRAVVRA
jgi:branched-chain amino acid transport system permease protein